MLHNQENNADLVLDIGDRVVGNDEAYACTSNSNGIGPVTRSVFMIEKMDEKDGYKDDIVHYGQKIRIVSNPLIFPKKLYLRSLSVSPLHFARFSRKQEVALQTQLNYDTVWIIEHSDPNQRFKAERSPIKANEWILIKHCATDQHLASQHVEYKNDFGTEYEMSCFTFTTLNKSQQLSLEKIGSLSKDHPTKFNLKANMWMAVTSNDPSTNVPVKEKEELNDDIFMGLIHGSIVQNGIYGIRKLVNAFHKLDPTKSGAFNATIFQQAITSAGIQLNTEEMKRLVGIVDPDQKGITYAEFLQFIRVK